MLCLGRRYDQLQMNSTPLNPDLSVIIINWNTRQLLSQCLQSVIDNLHDLSFESFVVDNGSTDNSVEMIQKEFPEVTVIENRENLGFAKANNQAILLSNGRYILLLNSDAFLTPNAIQSMHNMMENNLDVGITGAHLVYPDGRPQVSHGPLPTFWSEVASLFSLDKLHKEKDNHNTYQETGTVSGACMLIRKSLLNQIGLLDEAFFMFSEEVDLCNRCHKAGAKVLYVKSAMVIHTHAGSTGMTVQRIMRLYSGKLQYFYKHFGSKVEYRLKHMMLIASMCKFVVYRLLRIISLGWIRKDDFWWDVSKNLLIMS
jgi:GT2 family glycosyltransferase